MGDSGISQDGCGHSEQLQRIGQSAGPGVGSGQPARVRFDHHGTAFTERRYVGLSSGVQPHLGVHRGSEDDGRASGQQDVGQQVVGTAARGSREQVSGRGRHVDQIGILAELDMRYQVDVVPDLRVHRLAGERSPGADAHKLQGRVGGHHGDVVAVSHQAAQQLAGLVGGDATRDTEDDVAHGLSVILVAGRWADQADGS